MSPTAPWIWNIGTQPVELLWKFVEPLESGASWGQALGLKSLAMFPMHFLLPDPWFNVTKHFILFLCLFITLALET